MRTVVMEKLLADLQNLGLRRGDLVFLAADLLRVGYFNKTTEQTLKDWIAIFDELLGKEGTIVLPSYTPVSLRFLSKEKFLFKPDAWSDSGSLPNGYLRYAPGLIRSTHPSNSCIAKGAAAESVLEGHDPKAPAYLPYKRVVDLGGKNLMLGSVDLKNAPMTFHCAQELLGHTKHHPLGGLFETRYREENGSEKNFVVREIGGCTRGGHKAWGYHLAAQAVRFGQVGKALSALVDAKKSLETFLEIFRSNPSLLRCDNRYCISCYGRYVYNGAGVLGYYPRKTIHFFVSRGARSKHQ